MAGQNISDVIEAYLKQILAVEQQIEINRADIAARFDCVPSQINYVIKTRFTDQQGYYVQSKRGGGGYIRIEKLHFRDKDEYLQRLLSLIGPHITMNKAVAMLNQLVSDELMTKHEAQLVATLLSDQALQVDDQLIAATLRANLLKALLTSLRYERF